MQVVEDIKPSYPLFRDDDYKDMLHNKQQQFEERIDETKLAETFQWTTTVEYQELNFKREALTINPAKACQPLGAVLCALGFEKTMPYVHGSQGCVAYFRTYFNRHFKEPISCVSDSMTEDAARCSASLPSTSMWPNSVLGNSMPWWMTAEPMPVPNVSRTTTPFWLRPAP